MMCESLCLSVSVRRVEVEQVEVVLPLLWTWRYGHVVAILLCEVGMWVLYSHNCFSFKSYGRRLSECGFGHYAFSAIVMVHSKC